MYLKRENLKAVEEAPAQAIVGPAQAILPLQAATKVLQAAIKVQTVGTKVQTVVTKAPTLLGILPIPIVLTRTPDPQRIVTGTHLLVKLTLP